MDPFTPSSLGPRARLSAVVIACNRAGLITTCLAALGFADEVVLIDKSSTDGTAERGAALADRVIRVPFSPTVEETRSFAAAAATHEWVLLLDDDECLSVAGARFIATELVAPRADIYLIPQRHYILGCHDERAYYWPEWQLRLFRRPSVTFTPTVHAPPVLHSQRVFRIPPETGVCLHHLSHRSVAEWIEKANRYTSRPDRMRAAFAGTDLTAFAHAAIDRWQAAGEAAADDAVAAVGLLRAAYDIIDRLKTWEEEHGLDGAAAFRTICAKLQAEYAAARDPQARPHRAPGITAANPAAAAPESAPRIVALRSMLDALRRDLSAQQARHAAAQDAAARQLRDAVAEGARRMAERDAAREGHLAAEAARRQAEAARVAAAARAVAAETALRMMQASTIWRATAPLRRFVAAQPRLAALARRVVRPAREALAPPVHPAQPRARVPETRQRLS